MPAPWGWAATILLLGVWLGYVIWANTDLTVGRFALFMDERIIFDGVWNILHPPGLKAFVYALVSGGDNRYGRLLWTLTAVTSFVPERLWGDTGLIIAERMTQALLLAGASVALTLMFVQRWALRLLLLALLLLLPFSDYYAAMPKPEPLELALVAAFLWFHKRRGYGFGPYWLLLGMAFGAKIAALPLVLVIGICALLQDRQARGRLITLDEAIDTGSAFFLGLGLVVPRLLLPIGIALVVIYGWRRFGPASSRTVRLVVAVFAMVLGLAIGRNQAKAWFGQTFANTAHGRDQASINFLSWMDYFVRGWMGNSLLLSLAVIGSACLLLALWVCHEYRGRNWRLFHPGLMLVAGGLAMIAAIFVSSHRLWGFYLLPGTVLLLVGLFSLVEGSFVGTANVRPDLLKRGLALVLLVSTGVLGLFWWAPERHASFHTLAHRTDEPDYRSGLAIYRAVTATMSAQARASGRPISVMLDPVFFQPQSTAEYTISNFWGPYTDWTQKADLVVLGPTHTPAGVATPSDSPEYPAFQLERAEYVRHVADRGAACPQAPCFQRIAKLEGGGEILAPAP
jgi:hypothetical protein